MAPMFEKHFTLDQANALIPHVRRLFAEVRALLTLNLHEQNEDAGGSDGFAAASNGQGSGNGTGKGSANGHDPQNGNGVVSADMPGLSSSHIDLSGLSAGETAATSDYSQWSEEKRHEAAYRLLNALQSQGIVIQDVERGLIDFPAFIDDREVFLCYELSDGHSIQYYHDIEAGYAGRKKITETDQ